MTITRKAREQAPLADDFMTRAIHRMHEVDIIDAGARDRLLSSPPPKDPYCQIGILRALLSVAIWRDDEPGEVR